MLRKEGPMDARAITLRLMAERELNVNDSGLQKAMHKRIGAALRNLRERTLVTSRSGSGGLLVWSLAKNP
jgi:restriction endonuclease Mrr